MPPLKHTWLGKPLIGALVLPQVFIGNLSLLPLTLPLPHSIFLCLHCKTKDCIWCQLTQQVHPLGHHLTLADLILILRMMRRTLRALQATRLQLSGGRSWLGGKALGVPLDPSPKTQPNLSLLNPSTCSLQTYAWNPRQFI